MELELAEAILDGRWAAALDLRFHPLYAALTAALNRLTGGSLESSAALVSTLSSSLVAPACALTAAALCPRRPRRAALVAGLLAACHPYLARLGGQVMAYSLAHVCLALAVLAAVGAAQRRSAGWAALAGAAVGVGYLARSDALVTGLGLGLGLCAASWRSAEPEQDAEPSPERSLHQRLALPAAFALGVVVCMSPYVLAIRAHSGEWRLSLKKSVESVLVSEQTESHPAGTPGAALSGLIHDEAGTATVTANRRSLPSSLLYALRVGASTALPSLLVLLAIGVLAGRPPPGWALGALAALVFVIVHGFLKHNWNYTSRIHQSALGVLVVPLAGRGLVLGAEALARRLRKPSRLAVGLALCGVLLAGPIPKALRPNRAGRAPERAVGEWIRADFGPGTLVVAGWESRVPAHYAGAEFRGLPPGDLESVVGAIERSGVDYLVIHLRSHGSPAGQLVGRFAEAGLKPVHRVSSVHPRRPDVRYTWLVFRLP